MSATERMKLVNAGDFQTLFLEELGWDRPDQPALRISVDALTYEIEQVAGFSGLRVWLCEEVPDARTQRLIDQQVRKVSDARLLIFADEEHQEWRWFQTPDANGGGKPRLALHHHYVGTSNEALNQRLGTIEIKLNENPTLIEVLRRMRAAFDADVVTRRFYDQFVRRQRALTEVVEGIADDGEREWYSALLMNRLMFIYFMQKKQFMDSDTDYLRNRLNRLHDMIGGGQFYGFYRDFLLPMFHLGLGDQHHDYPSDAIRELVGDVPYINGGIFSEHELERNNTIYVPDEIFTSIFDLFDRFQWHLDDRPTAAQNEINPDVLGYIFEQFVNEKESQDNRGSDKGAYYTKEDVTHFMASNAMVPVFLERLIERTGVNPWRYVREAPESYIWASLAWGTNDPLPPEIEAQREDRDRPLWGTLADETYGLPGETWWEVDRRRQEHAKVLAAARAGEIDSVNRAVTENIDLEQLAIDVIDQLNAPEQALTAWQILSGLRVIDPAFMRKSDVSRDIRELSVVHAELKDPDSRPRGYRSGGRSPAALDVARESDPTTRLMRLRRRSPMVLLARRREPGDALDCQLVTAPRRGRSSLRSWRAPNLASADPESGPPRADHSDAMDSRRAGRRGASLSGHDMGSVAG